MASSPESKKDEQPQPEPTSLEERFAAMQKEFAKMEKRNAKVEKDNEMYRLQIKALHD